MTDEQMQIVLIVFWKKAYYEEIAVIFKRKLQYEKWKWKTNPTGNCITRTKIANIETAKRVQNSLNRRDAKSDVIPEAYKLWTRQHAVWGQSISISISGEWLGFHSTVQCAYPSLKIYICINRMSQKKVRNEFSSLSLSKIAKIIRTSHNRFRCFQWGPLCLLARWCSKLKNSETTFFWDALYVFNGFLMTKNVFYPQYLLTLNTNQYTHILQARH